MLCFRAQTHMYRNAEISKSTLRFPGEARSKRTHRRVCLEQCQLLNSRLTEFREGGLRGRIRTHKNSLSDVSYVCHVFPSEVWKKLISFNPYLSPYVVFFFTSLFLLCSFLVIHEPSSKWHNVNIMSSEISIFGLQHCMKKWKHWVK